MQLTPRAENVMRYAQEAAELCESGAVGTEHILIGICRENEGLAIKAITLLGVRVEDILDAVARLVKP